MNKSQLVISEARRRRVSPGSAADEVDIAVNRIIRSLRRGNVEELPGLGQIRPGKRWTFLSEKKSRG